jgi:hypothetical protein
MKVYWGSGGIDPLILRPRHWMEASNQLHSPAALPLGKEPQGNHWIGGWVGPRVILDAVVKREIRRTSTVQPVVSRYI